MRVGFYQFSPGFGDVTGNLARAREALSRLEADLVVLPELFNTGYQFLAAAEARELAEPIPGGPTTEALSEVASHRRMWLVAGLVERDGDALYNSAILVGPEGYLGRYRKLHLFYEEKLWFQPGTDEPPVFDVGTARLGLMICFDWIFPETARMLALKGADILCHPANLIFKLCHEAMVTRCLENRVFAVTCNRVGREARKPQEPFQYTGGSQVVDPRGRLLVRAGDSTEEGQVVEIEPERARDKDFNLYNNLVRDRRLDLYGVLTRPVVF